MATYYVRKTGVDTNAGTSAGAAWLTVGKFMSTAAAGDTCYVGAGVYKENGLSPTNSGSAGNVISLIGDITGANTGDGGLVRITASTDDSTYSASNVFNVVASRSYFLFDSLWMDLANGDGFTDHDSSNTNFTVQNCWVTSCKGRGIRLQGVGAVIKNCRVWHLQPNGYQGIVSEAGGTIDSCIVESLRGTGSVQGIVMGFTASSQTGTVKNCFVNGVDGDGGAPDTGIYVKFNSNASCIANIYNNQVQKVKGGGANSSYGIYFENCVATDTINHYDNSYQQVYSDAGTSNTYAIFIGGTAPTINSDYNQWSDVRDGVSGYTANTHDKANNSRVIAVPPLPLSGMGYFHPAQSAGYDTGTSNSGSAPTVDINGLPRGGAFGWDIGAFEKQGAVVKDSSTFNTAAPATRIDGAGFIDFKFAINTTKTVTIKAYLKTNSSYSGTQPSLTVLSNGIGMSGTVTYSGASNAWQQVTIPTGSMVSSGDGIITVRFQSYSVAASSSAWIDDITIAEA